MYNFCCKTITLPNLSSFIQMHYCMQNLVLLKTVNAWSPEFGVCEQTPVVPYKYIKLTTSKLVII